MTADFYETDTPKPAHLFEAEDVDDAGKIPSGFTADRVTSVCGQVERYGLFIQPDADAWDDAGDDRCGLCARTWRKHHAEEDADE